MTHSRKTPGRQGPDAGIRRGGRIRENLEAIVGAIAVALLIRTFAAEPYSIPTGSMSPTLLGEHVDLSCGSCNASFSAAAPFQRDANRLPQTCPNCSIAGPAGGECSSCGYPLPGEPAALPAGGGGTCPFCLEEVSESRRASGRNRSGDKILVDKVSYRFRSPRRWEVAVFRRPGLTSMNFVKRIVGLPGEEVALIGGDVVIDGRIASKPDFLQESLWFPVYSTDRAEPGSDAWSEEARGWEWTDEGIVGASEGRTTLRYVRPIRDVQPYNLFREGGEDRRVGDIRLTVEVVVESGEALLVIERNGQKIAAGLSKDGRMWLEVGGEPLEHRVEGAARGPISFGAEVLDGEASVRFGEEEVITVRLGGGPEEILSSGASIGVSGGRSLFTKIEIHRDIHYSTVSDRGGMDFPYQTQPGEFILLGDNSPSSKDSRYLGPVPEQNILGKGFAVFWPPIPGRIGRIP